MWGVALGAGGWLSGRLGRLAGWRKKRPRHHSLPPLHPLTDQCLQPSPPPRPPEHTLAQALDLTLPPEHPYRQACGLRAGSDASLVRLEFRSWPPERRNPAVPPGLQYYTLQAQLSGTLREGAGLRAGREPCVASARLGCSRAMCLGAGCPAWS